MKIKMLAISLFLLSAIPLIGYSADEIATNSHQTANAETKPLYWVDPMEPNIHYSAPGKSRMGMELVPVYPKKKTQ